MARRRGDDMLVNGAKVVVAVFVIGLLLWLVSPAVISTGVGLVWYGTLGWLVSLAGLVGVGMLAVGLWRRR